MIASECWDVIIAGAGSAGCVLASRLTEDPARRVLLIEAGPDYSDPSDLPPDVRDGSKATNSHDWGFLTEPGPAGRVLAQPRGRLTGGCSATNHAVAVRGQASDYDAWQAAGNPGWSGQDVLPYFRKLETDVDYESDQHGRQGPIRIGRCPPGELTILNAAALEAAHAAGHRNVSDHNSFGEIGAGVVPLNVSGGKRQSTAATYLAAARSRPNLGVLPETVVSRVIVRDQRARGVQLAEGQVISADAVILAAGVFGSPMALMRSGIGPADHLSALGIPVVVHLPGVGENLTDHPRISSEWPIAPDTYAVHTYQILVTTSTSRCSPGVFDFAHFAGYATASSAGRAGPVFWLSASLMKPWSRGRVRLRSADPDAPPLINLGLLDEPHDLEQLLVGLASAREICSTKPLCDFTTGDELIRADTNDSPSALRRAIRGEVRSGYHQVGTCAMGPVDRPGAVVDARCRVHTVGGLWVVDASVMPEIPSANTNIPTIMLAERVCAWLTNEL